MMGRIDSELVDVSFFHFLIQFSKVNQKSKQARIT